MSWTRHIPISACLAGAVILVQFAQPGAAVEPGTATKVSIPATGTTVRGASGQESSKQLFRGVGSCSASNCHGGDPSAGIVGSEYSIWVQNDQHAEAYSVLLNDESRQMARLLGLEKEAHEAPLCLNCHSPQRYQPEVTGELPVRELLNGVGCESCHGGADGWLAEHVRWNNSTPPQHKASTGFIDTDDLWTRAKMCADCHVGAPGRDVKHDHYAAGHPRLFFEFSAFMANLPIHWNVSDNRKVADWSERPGIEAATWALGQIASAEASVDLMIYRAERSVSETYRHSGKYPSGQVPPVWPEYAETGCFACHHDLKADSWRQRRGFAGRVPGQYPWGTWTLPLMNLVAGELSLSDDNQMDHSVSQLRSLMARPAPSAMAVISEGKRLRQRLNQAAGQFPRVKNGNRTELQLTLGQVTRLRDAVASAGADVAGENWDGATQVFLALTALQRAHRDLRQLRVSDPEDPVLKALIDFRKTLEFPDGHDSPRTYSQMPVDEALKMIHTSIDSKE